MNGLEYYLTGWYRGRDFFMHSEVVRELQLELVPEDRKDLTRWKRLGGMLVALPKAIRLEYACLFSSK